MNIFVAGSSRNTKQFWYNKAAVEVGKLIAKNGDTLVFGGCSTGLVGKVYDEVRKNSECKIIVGINKAYESDLETIDYTSAYVLDTLGERKTAFMSLADVMIFLPGGIGTIDELYTMIEAKRCKEHNKPIITFSLQDYFTPIFEPIHIACGTGFSDPSDLELIRYCNSTAELEILLNKFYR